MQDFRPKDSSILSRRSTTRETLLKNIKKWRQAKKEDITNMHSLKLEEVARFFGPVDLDMLLLLSLYSFTCENTRGDVIGFFCLNTFPPIPALLPEVWGHWIKTHYGLTSVDYENSYFIHYLVWDINYSLELLTSILNDVFLATPKLQNIFCIAPPLQEGTEDFVDLLEGLFKRVWPIKYPELQSCQSLFVCARKDLLPVFRLRKAIPEDNDDLLEILDETHPKFREKYGEFYIAKTLLKQEASTSIIVAHINTETVGLLWLNSSVDVDKINKNFNIFPFQSLKRSCPNKRPIERTYIEVVRKHSKDFFESISLPSNENSEDVSDELCSCSISYEDDGEEYVLSSESSEERGSMHLLLSWNRNFLADYNSMSESNNPFCINWDDLEKKLDDYKVCYKYSKNTVKEPRGPPSAFAIQLFAMAPDLDDRRSYDMLVAAFDAFPNKSYCVMTLPSTKPCPAILQYFTKVIPRPECAINESLYVLHKNMICGRNTVARIKGSDLENIKKMLKYGTDQEIKPAREIMFMIRHSLMCPQKKYDALVVKNVHIIIGIIILTLAEDINLLRKYYQLDEYVNYKNAWQPELHGKVLYMYINPIVEGSAKNIFNQIYRITGFHSLYYTLEEPEYLNPYNNLLMQMYPIRPRRVLPMNFYTQTDDTCKELNPFLLFHHNIHLVRKVRINIDLKIVIIGFSGITKAFLEYIIFNKNAQKLVFTNLTVIAPPGVIEADYAKIKKNSHLLHFIPKYNRDYQTRLGFMTWVNFVSDIVVDINRQDKYLILEKEKRLSYDSLYIFENWHFGLPINTPQEFTVVRQNFQIMNTALDYHLFHYRINIIKKLLKQGANHNIHKMSYYKNASPDYSIVVYGNPIRAFGCVNYLIESGIVPQNIHFLTNYFIKSDIANFSHFYDDYIKRRAFEELERKNVNIYKGYKFEGWISEDNVIKKLCFVAKFRAIWLDCTLFVSFQRRPLSRALTKTLRGAGLVVDGGLVINTEYQTNDPNIFSCGTATVYKRNLYARKFQHIFYNHHEVAEHLAEKTVEKLKRVTTNKKRIPKNLCYTLPIYKKPRYKAQYVTGDLFITVLKFPGYQLPRRLRRLLGAYDCDIFTNQRPFTTSGELECDVEAYCRIHLDKKGFIRGIFCLTKGYKNLELVYRLYGLHESLLGLRAGYESGEIKDFLKFFQTQWLSIITYDRFKNFLNDTKILERNILQRIPKMYKILKLIAEGQKRSLSNFEQCDIKRIINQKKSRQQIEKKVFEFVSQEDEDKFFMYATMEFVENELSKYGIQNSNADTTSVVASNADTISVVASRITIQEGASSYKL